MKVLLTGGTGYIGSHTAVELLSRNYDVVIADNFVNSKPEVLNRIEKITGKRPIFYQADVCDASALDKIFRRSTPSFTLPDSRQSANPA